ncbi:MAG: hypothetical protein HY963_02420 [Ignavibacteriales bacterium]|nr:hypothetical protein [Ignavibacteriales bacterium]
MHKFIKRMILRNAVNASLQYINTYIPQATANQRLAYRETLKEWLEQLALRYYACEYDANKYCNEIISLKEHLLANHGQILTSLTLGICQKPITLWLKYLWLIGDASKKPLFATIDRDIMNLAHIPNPPNWSEIDTIEEYLRIVSFIDNYAIVNGFGSGSVWEAENWSDEIE